MDPAQLIALTSVAHHTFDRLRERIQGVFVPMHRAYTGVQASRARAGYREVLAGRLLVEAPRLGLGDFLDARLASWIAASIEGTRVTGTANDAYVALTWLLIDGARPPHEVFADMPPLEWHDRARAAADVACQEMHARVGVVIGSSPTSPTAVIDAARIVEAFCVSAGGAFTPLDTSAVHTRCIELLCSGQVHPESVSALRRPG